MQSQCIHIHLLAFHMTQPEWVKIRKEEEEE